jgi:enoyl-CoA hydratase/carnithine racemase
VHPYSVADAAHHLTERASDVLRRAVSSGGVATETRGAVRWLFVDRPPRNLLDPEAMAGLAAELRRCDGADSVSAVVLSGKGETFCCGLDTSAFQHGADPAEFGASLVTLLRLFPTLGKPVLAAVNGDALASGFGLVCAADYAVAVTGAKLGTFEASVGAWPMIAQVPVLRRLLPRHALQNVLSGIPFDSDDALRVGAVNRVVAPDELADAVQAYADAAVRAGAALATGRRSFYRFLELGYDDALEQAREEFTRTFRSN